MTPYTADLTRPKDAEGHCVPEKNYWQHEDTGNVTVTESSTSPSSRWYKISAEAYNAHEVFTTEQTVPARRNGALKTFAVTYKQWCIFKMETRTRTEHADGYYMTPKGSAVFIRDGRNTITVDNVVSERRSNEQSNINTKVQFL